MKNKPRNGRYSYIAKAMDGKGPYLWIRVEASYNRIYPTEARQIAALLLSQARWLETQDDLA